MDKPQELLIATFSDQKAAGEALKSLKKWSKDNHIDVLKAATIKKDEKGKTSVDQDQDVNAGEGSLLGAVVGGVIGLLGGPGGAIVGAAAGAATGGATAAAVNMGFSNEDMDAIRASLPPNSSALITLAEDTWVEDMNKELKSRSGRTWHRPVPDDYYRNLS